MWRRWQGTGACPEDTELAGKGHRRAGDTAASPTQVGVPSVGAPSPGSHPDSKGHHRRGRLSLAPFPHFTPQWTPQAELVAPCWVGRREERPLCRSPTHRELLAFLVYRVERRSLSPGAREDSRDCPQHSNPLTAPLTSHTTCDGELTPSPASLAAEQSPQPGPAPAQGPTHHFGG